MLTSERREFEQKVAVEVGLTIDLETFGFMGPMDRTAGAWPLEEIRKPRTHHGNASCSVVV